MEKGITISQTRLEYFLRIETKFELAQSIYRNNDAYDADKLLKPILGPKDPTEEKKCDTI